MIQPCNCFALHYVMSSSFPAFFSIADFTGCSPAFAADINNFFLNRKCTKDTFKGSLFGCQENVSNTTLTIVCTINVSIDCDCFDVSNPSERKNIHKIKSSQWDAWFVFVFLK